MADKTADNTTTAGGRDAGPTAPASGKGPDRTAVTQPQLGFIGMCRWAWRQLTTMRVALILLLVLALASIPGSLLPQRIQDPGRVNTFLDENGAWGGFLDAIGMFDVYSSIWFSAVYLLLMISLVGCIVPRAGQHWKAMRSAPPKGPRRLGRMPGYVAFTSAEVEDGELTDEEFLDAAQARLKKLGYRTSRYGDHVAAERGYLRETGNLVFHIAVLMTTLTMAIGSLFGYEGQRVLVEGDTFTNSLVAYDSFDPGTYYDPDNLPQFRLTLDDFEATFDDQALGNQFGQPRTFEAQVTSTVDGKSKTETLKVNEPIRVADTGIYLTGNGYAPEVTVRDATGKVVRSGPQVFIPANGDPGYTSEGAIKVPDAAGEQMGFVGVLLPTATQNEQGDLVSNFAELRNPYLVMSGYTGDLGLDSGVPQSVYTLDASRMTQMTDASGDPLVIQLVPGETQQLPNGGSVTFDGVKRFIAVDISQDPTQALMFISSALVLIGLGLSLFIPRRRMWVRIKGADVEVAALARGEDPMVERAARELAKDLGSESRDDDDDRER
ncbi:MULTISPECIES: cytochrome c biogenesis protein ResB [Brevibacterium]|uniref:Cytochrome C biosynthesis protein n=5 Tax=Bacteria TaxID=2 RepID=K9AS39_9MICO|nr:cytochrome c biogenesis protein ResB [Brevibacterium casei]EKU45407.1 cytochrome C biosynthesis protein [Brevibacterium casei S18]KZE22477.1 cytochrome C biogenesis protein ResB [Brevibacterium casei]MCT2184533.1 cytochrome c biogenesis protein ResB [Brevibacterium casei]MDH5149128.1 cytochrome c biogenesis protein ResB [Brevibacterium casei]PAK93511.1 cytochrome C biogenesis protein ResB [Brevibacterium casei]